MVTNVGKWDSHYEHLQDPHRYGDTRSYELAAEWMEGCATVEDWGCGGGFLRQFIDPSAYRGIDGSSSPFADRVCDLVTYRTVAEGIVLRHVLEHETAWVQLLDNAITSFTKRLFIAIFTPMGTASTLMFTEPDYGDAPVLSLSLAEIVGRFPEDVEYQVETIDAPGSAYRTETLLRLSR